MFHNFWERKYGMEDNNKYPEMTLMPEFRSVFKIDSCFVSTPCCVYGFVSKTDPASNAAKLRPSHATPAFSQYILKRSFQ